MFNTSIDLKKELTQAIKDLSSDEKILGPATLNLEFSQGKSQLVPETSSIRVKVETEQCDIRYTYIMHSLRTRRFSSV